MTDRLPHWAKKPRHRKSVIAKEDGWYVEETGECLMKVKDLLSRLKNLEQSIKTVLIPQFSIVDIQPVIETAVETNSSVPVELQHLFQPDQNIIKQEIPEKRRPGRPKGSKNKIQGKKRKKRTKVVKPVQEQALEKDDFDGRDV